MMAYDIQPADVQQAIGLVNSLKPQLERALAKPELAERMARCVITEVGRNPALAACDPKTFVTAVYESAQCKLEVGRAMGQAYLVPFGRECTLIIGFKGLIDLAYRSGAVKDIYAENVYAKDSFRFVRGSEPRIEHEPSLGMDRGDYIGTYAVAHTVQGGTVCRWVPAEEMEGIKKRSASARKRSGPWIDHEQEMQLKTALRRIVKILPASVFPHAVHSHLEQEDAREYMSAREAKIIVQNPAPGMGSDAVGDTPPSADAPAPRGTLSGNRAENCVASDNAPDLKSAKATLQALLKTLPPDVADRCLFEHGIDKLDKHLVLKDVQAAFKTAGRLVTDSEEA